MNSTIQWPDASLPARIYCAPGVLTSLEIAAVDGLLAMPRIGLGIGGLLLGRRGDGRIEILKAVDIPCSHAMGPSFGLTAQEVAASRNRLEKEAAEGEVVGWYCSKTGGQLTLTERDHALYDALCPEAWQLALLIRPSRITASTGVFGLREGPGFAAGKPYELAWQELSAYQTPVTEPMKRGEVRAAETPRGPAASLPDGSATVAVPREPAAGLADGSATVAVPRELAVGVAEGSAAAAVPTEPVEPEAVAAPTPTPTLTPTPTPEPPFTGPLFGVRETVLAEPPEGKKRSWGWLVFVAILFLLVGLGAAAYLNQEYWMPRSPVALLAYPDWTGRVSFIWNAEALENLGPATLVIEDGGPLHTIHLDRAGIRIGWYQFDCRSGTVTATLLAGDATDKTTVKVAAETYLPESGISK
jgi:hypothetical protein